MTNDLAALSEAATPGPWESHPVKGYAHDEVYSRHPDAENACICAEGVANYKDAPFIVALVNAYRSGDFVLIEREGMREKCATAIHGVLSRANVTAYLDMPVETAGWCADAAIAAMLGGAK